MRLSLNEEVQVVLTEYAALRRELEEQFKVSAGGGALLLLPATGLVISAENVLSSAVLLMLAPAGFMVVHALWSRHVRDAERIGRAIARIEDRIHRLTGIPYITHETELILQRRQDPLAPLRAAIALCAGYVIAELLLYIAGSDGIRRVLIAEDRSLLTGRIVAVILALVTAPAFAIRQAYLLSRQRKHRFRTRLSDTVAAYVGGSGDDYQRECDLWTSRNDPESIADRS